MKLTTTLLAIASLSTVNAATLTWTGATDNNWFDATNWTPNQVPNNSDDDITINSGTPVALSNVNISSGGSVTINGGDVEWSGRFHTVGNTSAANFLITGGSLSVNYAGGSSHAFNIGNNGGAGVFQQQGGTVSALFSNDQMFIKSGGRYEISGGVFNAGSIVNGVGTFNIIGDASTINLTSSYTQDSFSTLDLDINGISTINVVGGLASLAGILDISFLSTPSLGQTFDIIQYGSLSGTFDTFDTLVDSPLGLDTVSLGIDYGVNGDTVQVSVLSVVPEPTSSALLLTGLLGGVFRRSRR